MSFISFWKKAWKVLKVLQEIRRQRRELLKLDDRMLNDIGISRVDAEREAKRPFWDVVGVKDLSLRERNPPKAFKTGIGENLSACMDTSGLFRAEGSRSSCCGRDE